MRVTLLQCLLLWLDLLCADGSEVSFNPDPGVAPINPRTSSEAQKAKTVSEAPPSDPAFNPDPGVPPLPLVRKIRGPFGLPETDALKENPPVVPIVRQSRTIFSDQETVSTIEEPAPLAEELRENELHPARFNIREYPETSAGELPFPAEPRTNRWSIRPAPWQRYTSGQAETPYQNNEPALWHPYRQSLLKGDLPIAGQDLFLNLSASLQSELEFRRLPATSAEELLSQNYLGFSVELFKGETVFRPANWRLLLRPVSDVNHLDSKNLSRTETFFALQEAYFEKALTELSSNFDFVAARLGNQTFNSDFRGFIFNDVNTGARFFGNALNNRWQYNLAVFDMREKETFSELNSFDERGQQVIIANLYRQDTLWPGYTAQFSFHANLDHGDEHRNQSGTPVRPAPLPGAIEHDVSACYFGWTGDGHIGRVNITHAFYQTIGRDDFNALAGSPVNINAQMAALELSLDQNWLRYKGSFLYASGDSDPSDGTGGGFDAILESPFFAGAPFSAFGRQSFSLGGGGVNLKGRNSFLPSMRASKLEGQANFVNPGILLFGAGAEARLTQELRLLTQANYVRFADTSVLDKLLATLNLSNNLGVDLSTGIQYRPFLVNNVVLQAGFGAMVPLDGYRAFYPNAPFPYSGLLTLTLSY